MSFLLLNTDFVFQISSPHKSYVSFNQIFYFVFLPNDYNNLCKIVIWFTRAKSCLIYADMDEEVFRRKKNKDNFICVVVSFKDFPVI